MNYLFLEDFFAEDFFETFLTAFLATFFTTFFFVFAIVDVRGEPQINKNRDASLRRPRGRTYIVERCARESKEVMHFFIFSATKLFSAK
jgi:hypothetical protein